MINVLGSFLLGLVMTLAGRNLLSPEWRLALGTGMIGAFTTFSTFEWDSYGLLSSGENDRALLSILGNLLGGYSALLLGRWLAMRVGLSS